MKSIFITTLLILSSNLFGQINFQCYEKEFCISSDDTSECTVSEEKSTFELDNKKAVINYTSGNIVTIYHIDSEQNLKDITTRNFSTHTDTGERANVSINSKTIRVMSLDYPEITLTYKIITE